MTLNVQQHLLSKMICDNALTSRVNFLIHHHQFACSNPICLPKFYEYPLRTKSSCMIISIAISKNPLHQYLHSFESLNDLFIACCMYLNIISKANITSSTNQTHILINSFWLTIINLFQHFFPYVNHLGSQTLHFDWFFTLKIVIIKTKAIAEFAIGYQLPNSPPSIEASISGFHAENGLSTLEKLHKIPTKIIQSDHCEITFAMFLFVPIIRQIVCECHDKQMSLVRRVVRYRSTQPNRVSIAGMSTHFTPNLNSLTHRTFATVFSRLVRARKPEIRIE